MNLPTFNPHPGRVLAAKIARCFDSSDHGDVRGRVKPFFLVLTIGHCKFCLSVPLLVAHLLHSSLIGLAHAFEVVQLDQRVFRFSLASAQKLVFISITSDHLSALI